MACLKDVREKLKRADWSAEIYRLINNWHREFVHQYYTFALRTKCKIGGVKLGRNVSFNGKMYISRFKHSTIIIGNHCIFNSHDLFNSRGLGRSIVRTNTDYAKIEIGDNSGFSGVTISANCFVKIGKNVMVGAGTTIADNDDHADRLGTKDSPVIIADNVFIGMRCIIMKGVTIGDNAIIGAGSIVTRDIPANCIAAGVPCKVIKLK